MSVPCLHTGLWPFYIGVHAVLHPGLTLPHIGVGEMGISGLLRRWGKADWQNIIAVYRTPVLILTVSVILSGVYAAEESLSIAYGLFAMP